MTLRNHNRRAFRLLSTAVLPLAIGGALLLASCSSGGGSGSAGLSIVSCSLGCSNSASNPGAVLSCNVTDVFVNQDFRITFSGPIDLLSVTNNTFRVTELQTGMTPPGEFSLDPNNSNVLIYRPMITFDSSGNPIFGLSDDQTYILQIPGTILDPLGPWVTGENGNPNSSRLACNLVASRGIFDTNPGPPLVTSSVVQVFPGDDGIIGTEDDVFLSVNAANAVDVASDSPITFVFDDIMNPGVLANPVTQTSDFITVNVDPDGNLLDPSDQTPVAGTYQLVLDQDALRTTVTFTPTTGYPSGAGGRRIVVEFSDQISDLGGNNLINGDRISFQPQIIIFDPLVVNENFESNLREDPVRTGGTWDGGLLVPGLGGGSGRLGDLAVPSGQVVVLDTDSEDFDHIEDLAIFNPNNIIDGGSNFTVEGGVFEFARLRVDSGGVLTFTGSNPARLYVRGEAVVQGQINISGTPGLIHAGTEPTGLGGVGGPGGPGGGPGGSGGARPDGTGFPGGTPNPGVGPYFDETGPADYTLLDGESGLGILFPDTTMGPDADRVAGGGGGVAWPQPVPGAPNLNMPRSPEDTEGIEVEYLYNCIVATPSSPGGGGAYSISGSDGDANLIPGSVETTAPPTSPGGNTGDLMIDEAVRSLDPELGLLRGGAGGGGAGAHIQLSKVNGIPLDPATNCTIDINGDPTQVETYLAHSGAGGGGGGGALQITSGRRTVLNGTIAAGGGDGGSFDPAGLLAEIPALAQAGGAGSGGAVLLQSAQLQIQAIPNRIDVSGGFGGIGPFDSVGGSGGPGLVRLESSRAPDFEAEKLKIVPTPDELRAQYGGNGDLLFDNILTTASWTPAASGVSGFTGAQSCWIQPEGNFFRLQFGEDDPAEGILGWDMLLSFADQAEPQSYRGVNDITGGTLEDFMGNDFDSGAVLVRFQGARVVGTLIDPCNVLETGLASPLIPGSITEWVEHPALLNSASGNPSEAPNIFRFVVLFNRGDANFEGLAGGIQGVEELDVTLIPD